MLSKQGSVSHHIRLQNIMCGHDAKPVVELQGTMDLGPGLWQLWGSNGSGKSTFLATLGQRIPLLGGTMEMDTPGGLVSYTPEHGGFWDDLTIGENLELAGLCHGLSRAVSRSRAKELQEFWQLPAQAKLAGELSSGEGKRLALSLSLIANYPIYLWDEPFTTLDVHALGIMAKILKTLVSAGKIILVASHGWPQGIGQPTGFLGIQGGTLVMGPPPEVQDQDPNKASFPWIT